MLIFNTNNNTRKVDYKSDSVKSSTNRYKSALKETTSKKKKLSHKNSKFLKSLGFQLKK